LSEIKLKPTVDILKDVSALKNEKKLGLRVIGFAAESQKLKENAIKKMQEKSMDMIAANNITQPQAGFGVDSNQVLLIFSDGATEQLPLMSKMEVAEQIMQHLVPWLTEGAD
jgi:Phosphopantothenoylcysteine synthetase/decarboxylase